MPLRWPGMSTNSMSRPTWVIAGRDLTSDLSAPNSGVASGSTPAAISSGSRRSAPR
jgi:hypothetical protein